MTKTIGRNGRTFDLPDKNSHQRRHDLIRTIQHYIEELRHEQTIYLEEADWIDLAEAHDIISQLNGRLRMRQGDYDKRVSDAINEMRDVLTTIQSQVYILPTDNPDSIKARIAKAIKMANDTEL